jgi:hypothetical protein
MPPPTGTELTPGHCLRMPWVSSRPARALVRPAGFIRPCQPYLADKPPSGPDWQDESEWDGYRIIAHKDGGGVPIWTRAGTDYPGCLDHIRAAAWRSSGLGRLSECAMNVPY